MDDHWTWRGTYHDGETIAEHDETGQARGFAAVDQSRLVMLEFLSRVDGAAPVAVKLGTDARPILFRRRTIIVDADAGTQGPGPVITVLGFQKTIRGKNTQAILALYDDGSMLLTDDSTDL